MNLISKKITAVTALIIFILSFATFANARELNLNGFSGFMNTTITSGVTLRSEDNDCLLQDGYKGTAVLNATGTAAFAAKSDALKTAGLNVNTKNKAGCATARVDGYGNTSTQHLAIGDVNSDNGKLNFPEAGDIIDATTKAFTEISGTTDSGLNVGISFIGNYNPVLDINAPAFKKLTGSAERELESDIKVLDAYIAGSLDASAIPSFDYIDYQVGRFDRYEWFCNERIRHHKT
jgi:hypothetical protein